MEVLQSSVNEGNENPMFAMLKRALKQQVKEHKLNIEIDVLTVERDEFKFKYHRQFKETLYRDYKLAREEAFVIYYRNKYEKEIIAAD